MQLLIFVFILMITLSFIFPLDAFQQQAVEYGAAGLQSQSSFQTTIYFGMLPRGLVPPSGPSTPINTRLTSATACLATMKPETYMLFSNRQWKNLVPLVCSCKVYYLNQQSALGCCLGEQFPHLGLLHQLTPTAAATTTAGR
ncbi:hypothetical protein JHK87_041345 [Glycine soja]|nr:hypothetical protein JHK87_041345 [Glycine soja]